MGHHLAGAGGVSGGSAREHWPRPRLHLRCPRAWPDQAGARRCQRHHGKPRHGAGLQGRLRGVVVAQVQGVICCDAKSHYDQQQKVQQRGKARSAVSTKLRNEVQCAQIAHNHMRVVLLHDLHDDQYGCCESQGMCYAELQTHTVHT